MKVAIFGPGTMGSGIAQVFAQAGNETYLYASSPASAQRHKDKLAAGLQKRVEKGKMTQEAKDALMANIFVEETAAFLREADQTTLLTLDGDTLTVKVPAFREDMESYPDVAEEVIRMYGYDHVTPTFMPTAKVTTGGNNAKRHLLIAGYNTNFELPCDDLYETITVDPSDGGSFN